jgi:hypothetical protein
VENSHPVGAWLCLGVAGYLLKIRTLLVVEVGVAAFLWEIRTLGVAAPDGGNAHLRSGGLQWGNSHLVLIT